MTPAQKRTKIEAKIKEQLATQTFGGYGGDSVFLAYDYETFRNFCAGELIVSIGEGKFRGTVTQVICYSVAWNEYWTERRRLEKELGL